MEEGETQPNVSFDCGQSDEVQSADLASLRSKFVIILGWIAMIATAYKCDHLQTDKVAFDPYEILGIDSVSSTQNGFSAGPMEPK